MKTSDRGMGSDESDWQAFRGHHEATQERFQVPAGAGAEVLAFVDSTVGDIVE